MISSAREHTYDMRQLESYTFTDEHNRDQGINGQSSIVITMLPLLVALFFLKKSQKTLVIFIIVFIWFIISSCMIVYRQISQKPS